MKGKLQLRTGVQQTRMVRPELVRVVETADGAPKRFIARVLRYNVVDDYGTMFAPGCVTESCKLRLPRITWAHDWAEPIGRWSVHEDTAEHLDLLGELDDMDAVPRARQAYAQLKSGTIDQFSIGFMPLGHEPVAPEKVDGRRDVIRFTRCRLDEAALVIVGAVPGTELLAVRSRRGERIVLRAPMISVDDAQSIVTQLGLGQITYDDAVNAITNAAVDVEPETAEESDMGEMECETEGEPETEQNVSVVVNVVTGDNATGAAEGEAEDESEAPESGAVGMSAEDDPALEEDMKKALEKLAAL